MESEFIQFKISRQLKAELLKRTRKDKTNLSAYIRKVICRHLKTPLKDSIKPVGRPVTKKGK